LGRVDAFRPFGGIRIEDDVVCTDDAPLNLTREDGKLIVSRTGLRAGMRAPGTALPDEGGDAGWQRLDAHPGKDRCSPATER
jgi:hypothetical protein